MITSAEFPGAIRRSCFGSLIGRLVMVWFPPVVSSCTVEADGDSFAGCPSACQRGDFAPADPDKRAAAARLAPGAEYGPRTGTAISCPPRGKAEPADRRLSAGVFGPLTLGARRAHAATGGAPMSQAVFP